MRTFNEELEAWVATEDMRRDREEIERMKEEEEEE